MNIRLETKTYADDDVARLERTLVDKDGNPAAEDKMITAKVDGLELLGLENGDIADCTSYTSRSRMTHHGRLAAYVRGKGDIVLSALFDGKAVGVSLRRS